MAKPELIPLSYGTDEIRARIAAATLVKLAGVKATCKQLRTASGQLTDWWHVYVPASQTARAEQFFRIWDAGRVFGRADMRAALQGVSLATSAEDCGVDLEILDSALKGASS